MKNICKDCNKSLEHCKCIEDTIELPNQALKDAAHEYFKRGQLGFEKASDTERAFLNGAKWQQERSYSEEDMREAYKYGKIYDMTSFEEWFEEFKNK